MAESGALFKNFGAGLNIGTNLALKKHDIDMEKAKFILYKKTAENNLNLANEKFEQEKAGIIRSQKAEAYSTILAQAIESGDQSLAEKADLLGKDLFGAGLPRGFEDPGVTDIASQLREDAGMGASEGMPINLPPSSSELLQSERDFQLLKTLAGKSSTTPTGTMKLINEINSLPVGDPSRLQLERKLEKDLSTTGERISIDPASGQVTIERGVGVGGMQKKTLGNIEEKIVNAGDQIARLKDIKASYKSEFLKAGPRANILKTKLKEKFQFGDISKADRDQLQDFTSFAQKTIGNINKHIKAVTGAQMSEKEANRIRTEMPDIGNSFLDWVVSGNSPSEFETRMDTAIELSMASQARYLRLRESGFTDEQIQMSAKENKDSVLGISVDDVMDAIEDYGNALKKQGASDQDVINQIEQRFFGGAKSIEKDGMTFKDNGDGSWTRIK